MPRPGDQAVATHRRLLEAWRGAMDLVGPGPLDPHFADAEAVAARLTPAGEWVDLGSGAGFPGLVLAARHPGTRFTLVERRQKRAVFLETVVSNAALKNVSVKAVDAARLPPGAWDGVVSRAFAPVDELLPLARRLLRPGGQLVLLLARERPEPSPGWRRFHVEPYVVDGKERRLETWIYADNGEAG